MRRVQCMVTLVAAAVMIVRANPQMAQLESAARLIASLRHHFYSGCVFLLYSPADDLFGAEDSLESTFSLVTIGKILLKEDVAFTTLDITQEGLWTKIRCMQNNPINVVLSSDELTRLFLVQASRRLSFVATFWLLFFDEDASALEEFVEDVQLPFDVEFLAAQQQASRDFRLWELHRVWRDAPLQRVAYGTWSGDARAALAPWPGLELYERRFDLHGYVFRAAVKDGFGTTVKRTKNNSFVVTGFFIDVWYLLATRNNFSTSFLLEPHDRSGGYNPRTGQWTGLVGMLQRGEADVAVSMLAMSPERRVAVNFPFPLLILKHHAYVRAPDSVVGWHKVLAPFDADLWAAVGACVLSTALCLAALSLGRAYCGGGGACPSDPATPCLRPHDAAFFALYAFQMQGGACEAPASSAGRLVLLTAYLTAVVVSASYSATLVASLAVAEVRPPFRTLAELLADGSYSAGVEDQTAQHSYFMSHDRPEARTVYDTLIRPDAANLVGGEAEGIARACSHRFAFVSTSVSSRDALRDANCSLLATPIDVPDAAASIGLARNVSFFKFINYNLQRMANFGILKRAEQQAMFERQRDVEPTVVTVTLQDSAPMLAALGTGCIISIFLLFLEIALVATRKRNLRYCETFANIVPKFKKQSNDEMRNFKIA